MQDIAVLLVAYRRSENLKHIFDLCLEVGVPRIYISLDGARGAHDKEDVERTQKIAQELSRSLPEKVSLKSSSINLGAARSVISACNWAFSREDVLIVLEDDCIPSIQFFQLCSDAKKILENESNIYLISGSQFAPKEILDSNWVLSKYPLIWGWMSSKSKWNELINEALDYEQRTSQMNLSSLIEDSYWRAGTRRAMEGYVDAWDIPIAMAFQKLQGFAIHPAQNLVTNIGQDSAATHTKGDSEYLGKVLENYIPSQVKPIYSKEIDDWYRKSFFKIRFRHLITVRLTKILDRCYVTSKVRDPLNVFLRELISLN